AVARQTTTPASVGSDATVGDDLTPERGLSISADARFVAFASVASNLVPDDTNLCGVCGFLCGPGSCPDIFVRDRLNGVTERVSVASDGTRGSGSLPSISANGRLVAFESFASNLVSGDTNNSDDVFVHDRLTGATERVSVASDATQGNGGSGGASISADGRFVAFRSNASNLSSGDTDGGEDVFVHDRMTGVTERVSVASDGTQHGEC